MTLRSFIDAFAQQICNGKPRLVPHWPEALAKHTLCIENVFEKIERDGGTGLFGWYFLNRRSPEHGEYLIATHHAIWVNSQNQPIDITPFHADEKHQPLSERDSIVFLLDLKAFPFRSSKGHCAPLANRFFPIDDRADLRAYLDDLSAKEKEACQRIHEELEKLP
jgi:hypothetical protein